jgi:arylsulfatase A-like enzyme
LIERGVRFVEVAHNLNFLNGIGWDVHNDGILNQHRLIQELDTAFSSLLLDLEEKRLLDRTLIMITTEFGRPPEFDSGGGRGHQGRAFTCVLAGGGLRHRGAWGETDELSRKIVANPVGLADFFATVCAAMGVDPAKSLYDGDRPVPITDQGVPIHELLKI